MTKQLLIAEASQYNDQNFTTSDLYGESPLLIDSELSTVGNPFESGVTRVVGSTTVLPSRKGTGIFFAGITQDPTPVVTIPSGSQERHVIFGNHEDELVRSYGLEINDPSLVSYHGMTMNSLRGEFSNGVLSDLKVGWIGLKSISGANLLGGSSPLAATGTSVPDSTGIKYTIGININDATIPIKQCSFSIARKIGTWDIKNTVGPQPFPSGIKGTATISGTVPFDVLKKHDDLLEYRTFTDVTLMLVGESKTKQKPQTWLVLSEATVEFKTDMVSVPNPVPFVITARKSTNDPSLPLYYIDVVYEEYLELKTYQ